MAQDDADTHLNHVKQWVRDFCEERGWDGRHGAKDLAIGLVTEASELLEIFRFRTEAEIAAQLRDPAAREAMADELADSLYFILRFAQLYKFDLSTCLREKLIKTARKYPVA